MMDRRRVLDRLCHRVARGFDRLRLRGCPGEGGQTLPLVLGIVLLLSLGTVMLASNTFQQFPIVSKDVIQHQAYRAMESGLDEYQYAVNANPNFASCYAKFSNGTSTPAAVDSSTLCSAMSFGTWISVPASGSSTSPPSWFLLDDPVINTSTGYLSIDIVGVAGYANDYNYQTAVVTMQPLNSFLLNVMWLNYDQIQPAVVDQYWGNDPTCSYYWPSDSLGNNCERLDFITGDSLTGNLFVNDSVFVCGSPSFQNVQTADNKQQYVQDGGCSGTPTFSGTKAYDVTPQNVPSDNSTLEVDAAANGCVYQGPTEITLTGSTMTVYSPGTPSGAHPTNTLNPATSSDWDPLNDAQNTANQCVPTSSTWSGPISVNTPANGVVYVQDCESSPVDYQEQVTVGHTTVTDCNNNDYTPLSNAGETGSGGDLSGDAIVQGTVSQPMIIGSANNVVIDGDICNSDTLSGGNCTTSTPAVGSSDILGLVADNYVEVNHPTSGSPTTCNSTTPGSGSVTCDLYNPIIDAEILALSGSFLVNNYQSGATMDDLNVYGTIDQDWRGPVGTDNGGTLATGYNKNYVYDPRLVYLSPPYYLSPGTSQWGFAAFTDASGSCKLASGSPYTSECGTYP